MTSVYTGGSGLGWTSPALQQYLWLGCEEECQGDSYSAKFEILNLAYFNGNNIFDWDVRRSVKVNFELEENAGLNRFSVRRSVKVNLWYFKFNRRELSFEPVLFEMRRSVKVNLWYFMQPANLPGTSVKKEVSIDIVFFLRPMRNWLSTSGHPTYISWQQKGFHLQWNTCLIGNIIILVHFWLALLSDWSGYQRWRTPAPSQSSGMARSTTTAT